MKLEDIKYIYFAVLEKDCDGEVFLFIEDAIDYILKEAPDAELIEESDGWFVAEGIGWIQRRPVKVRRGIEKRSV